jgi:hypothetical protein
MFASVLPLFNRRTGPSMYFNCVLQNLSNDSTRAFGCVSVRCMLSVGKTRFPVLLPGAQIRSESIAHCKRNFRFSCSAPFSSITVLVCTNKLQNQIWFYLVFTRLFVSAKTCYTNLGNFFIFSGGPQLVTGHPYEI